MTRKNRGANDRKKKAARETKKKAGIFKPSPAKAEIIAKRRKARNGESHPQTHARL